MAEIDKAILKHIDIYQLERLLAVDFTPGRRPLRSESGLQCIGAGHFTATYEHPTDQDLVIKVCYSATVDGSLSFLQWCRDQDNPYLPKVYSLFLTNDKTKWVCVSPRLREHCSNHEIETAFILERIADQQILGDYEVDFIARKYPGLIETLERVVDYLSGIADMDLHKDNVMWDDYGRPIINDPVSFTYDGDQPNGNYITYTCLPSASRGSDVMPSSACLRRRYGGLCFKRAAHC